MILKKIFRIAVVSSFSFVVLCFQLDMNVFAFANLSDDIISLEKIVVSSKRTETLVSAVADHIISIDKKEIEHFPANNVGEVLSYISEVDINVRNKFGQPTTLSMLGSDARHVLLLVDGIPFNTQLSGQANPTKLPSEMIERIEILKGASSNIWGSSLGGVINIITKDVNNNKPISGKFKSTFAEFSTTKNYLDIGGKINQFGYFLSGSYFESDGTKSRSNVTENKIFSKLTYDVDENSKILGSFGYSGAKVRDGVNSNNRWNSTPYISRYGKAAYVFKDEEKSLDINFKYNDQDITTDIFNATTGALVSATVSNNLYNGISLVGSLNLLESDLLVFGTDFDWHELKSNNYLTESKSINMQAPFLNYTKNIDKFDFILGLRYDRNKQFGSQTSPSFGVVYDLEGDKNTLIRAKISRAFNAPPLLWIYNNDPSLFVGPNYDLKAERSVVYEIGAETKLFEKLSLDLFLYRADVKDAIATVFNGSVYIKDNFKKFRKQGAELKTNYRLNKNLSLFMLGAFSDVVNKETDQIVRDAGIVRQKFSVGARFKSDNEFYVDLIGSYNRWSSTPDEAPNDRKFMLDSRISKTFKSIKENIDIEVFMNIYNLTNSKYWSDIAYPAPRRYFEGGFSLHF